MLKDHTSFLICPQCSSAVELRVFQENDQHVEEGVLVCQKCESFYPVIAAIPRLLAEQQARALVTGYDEFLEKHANKLEGLSPPDFESYETDGRIAGGFNFEWEHHSEILPEHELEFKHVCGDVMSPDSFQDKVVLDAGCGQGRFSYFAAKYGARFVVAMDMGEQVLLAKRNLKTVENSLVVQASIYYPPFKPVFDRIMSIGVIHHLPEPEKGFNRLFSRLRGGGDAFIWVYGYSSIIPIIRFLRVLTQHCGEMTNRILALPFAVVLYSLMKAHLLLKGIGLTRLAETIPWNMYHDRGFSNIWTITFDKLNSHIAVYYRRDDLEGWLERLENKEEGCLDERYAGKSGSSWRLWASKRRVAEKQKAA